jgi:hypothetical protein
MPGRLNEISRSDAAGAGGKGGLQASEKITSTPPSAGAPNEPGFIDEVVLQLAQKRIEMGGFHGKYP